MSQDGSTDGDFISQQRRDVGQAHGNVDRGGGRLDTEINTGPGSEGRCDYCTPEDDETTDDTLSEEIWRHSIPSKEPRDLDTLMLEPPTNTKGIESEIRGEGKTVVQRINGKAKQKTTVGALGAAQNS